MRCGREKLHGSRTYSSVRGLPQTTPLATVPARLGSHPTALSAWRAAASVFAAALLHEVVIPLGARRRPPLPLAEHAALAPWRAVDGSL